MKKQGEKKTNGKKIARIKSNLKRRGGVITKQKPGIAGLYIKVDFLD